MIEVTQKRMEWSAGMLCDITDEIEVAINQDDVIKAREFLSLLKEETSKLEDLMNKN